MGSDGSTRLAPVTPTSLCFSASELGLAREPKRSACRPSFPEGVVGLQSPFPIQIFKTLAHWSDKQLGSVTRSIIRIQFKAPHASDRRCYACYKWIRNHDGEERSREQVLAGLARVVVRKENEEQKGCQKPDCLKPFGGSKFYGEEENRRCNACYLYSKRNGGMARPAAVLRRRG